MKAFRETPPRRIIVDRKSMAKRRAMLRPRLSNFFEKKNDYDKYFTSRSECCCGTCNHFSLMAMRAAHVWWWWIVWSYLEFPIADPPSPMYEVFEMPIASVWRGWPLDTCSSGCFVFVACLPFSYQPLNWIHHETRYSNTKAELFPNHLSTHRCGGLGATTVFVFISLASFVAAAHKASSKENEKKSTKLNE